MPTRTRWKRALPAQRAVSTIAFQTLALLAFVSTFDIRISNFDLMALRDIFKFRELPESETTKPFLEHLED
jgi:hypothetical protein